MKNCKKSKVLCMVLAMVMVLGSMPTENIFAMGAKIISNSKVAEYETQDVDLVETVQPYVTEVPQETPEVEVTVTEEVPQETIAVEATAMPEVPAETPEATTASAVKSANIRLMFTTDLHGQLNTTNYETGKEMSYGSLARVKTLIDQAKTEKDVENTYLFDIGDAVYDYTTDYIYDSDASAVQPIYTALGEMGYDAITLGNHDFDYTFSYVKQQLKDSGLSNICVLSNVTNANTGNHIWKENMMITRQVRTADGTTMELKIGIIGETVPTLSSKRTNYKGVLKGDDIIENATKEAAKLKKQGADVVVVLAHTGIGKEEITYMQHNVAHGLTQIDDVDVVLAGHKHHYFPYYGNSSKYYSYPGFDKETLLMNGKNIVMVPSQGEALGMVDLTIEKDETASKITDRESIIRVADSSVKPDEKINNGYMGDWQHIFESINSDVLGEFADGERMENYFGMIEDNSSVQLINSAKISFAAKYMAENKSKYKDYPIIAASNYWSNGIDSSDDYVDIQGDFLKSYLSRMYRYRGIFAAYKVTGKNLREWIEWSASAYETAGDNIVANGNGTTQVSTMSEGMLADDMDPSTGFDKYRGNKPLQYAIRSAWREKISNFYVFDGVEYEITNKVAPRYDISGNQISDTHRVTSLTMNGVPVKDEDVFVVACDKLYDYDTFLYSKVVSGNVFIANELGRASIQDYVEEQSMNGTLKSERDENWHVDFDDSYAYIVSAGERSKELASEKNWYKDELVEDSGYHYYQAEFEDCNKKDESGPYLVLSALNEELTNKDVEVRVTTNDRSGVAIVKYTKGCYRTDAIAWNYATRINGTSFSCSENGIYSVLSEDTCGNRSVRYIRINNINKGVLQAPIVDSYSNRKTKITGYAEPKAKIYFEIKGGKTYSTTVKSNGSFSYSLPVQKAGKTIYVYVVDSKGRASARTVVVVQRTGPNKCDVDDIRSNSKKVTGTLNDEYVTLVALVGNTLYVDKNGGRKLYENSELYNSSYKVEEVKLNIDSKGKFSFNFPRVQKGESEVVFNTIDNIGRKSISRKKTVIACVPNTPKVDDENVVTNRDSSVEVYSDEKCKIIVKNDDAVSSSSDGVWDDELKKYVYNINLKKRKVSSKLYIYAKNKKGTSKIRKVQRPLDYVDLKTVKKGTKTIKGSISWAPVASTRVCVMVGKKCYTVKPSKKGAFKISLKKKVKKNVLIKCWVKDAWGKGLVEKYYTE